MSISVRYFEIILIQTLTRSMNTAYENLDLKCTKEFIQTCFLELVLNNL